jgi:hypothetical protein
VGRTGPGPNDRMQCEMFLSDGYRYRRVYASRCEKADLKLPSEAAVPVARGASPMMKRTLVSGATRDGEEPA